MRGGADEGVLIHEIQSKGIVVGYLLRHAHVVVAVESVGCQVIRVHILGSGAVGSEDMRREISRSLPRLKKKEGEKSVFK